MRRGERCYSLAVGQFQSWNQAEDYCSALTTAKQSHLINIESADKQQLVTELVSELITGEWRQCTFYRLLHYTDNLMASCTTALTNLYTAFTEQTGLKRT
jgi:hypothetical protein